MKYFLLLLLQVNVLFSQTNSIEGFVYSKKSNVPIENANVKLEINGKTLYASTDVNGKFRFKNVESYSAIYSIEISHQAYKKEIFNKITSKFYLAENINEIAEVNISSTIQKKIYELPLIDRLKINERVHSWGCRMAVFIPYEKEEKIIKKLLYAISDCDGVKGLKYLPFSANIYSVDSITKLPKAPIIKEKIIVRKKDNKYWVKVDVSQYQIKIPPEGLFVVMEILDKDTYKGQIVQSNTGLISAVPAIKAYDYNPAYIRKSYINYRPDSYQLAHIYDKWEEQKCHYLMDVEF